MARYTRKFQVVIGDKSTCVHVENESEAIGRAVEKLFGKRCFWFPDSGVPGYGQVFEALKPTKRNSQPGNSSVTYRIEIDVEPIGQPSVNFLKQQQDDRERELEISKQYEKQRAREYRAYNAGWAGDDFPVDLLTGIDSDWLKTEYNNGKYDAAEKHREQVEQEESERKQRELQEADERKIFLDEQYELALVEHRERMVRAGEIADRVAYIRSLSWDDLLQNSLVQAIIRNTIAPAEFERIGRGKMGLGKFKKKMLGGQYMTEVIGYLNSDNLYKLLENVEF